MQIHFRSGYIMRVRGKREGLTRIEVCLGLDGCRVLDYRGVSVACSLCGQTRIWPFGIARNLELTEYSCTRLHAGETTFSFYTHRYSECENAFHISVSQ